jgi:hypothetical protein
LGRSFVKIQAILISAAIAFGSSCAFADPVQHRFGGVLPPAKINGIVRSMGFMPAGPPVRNGPTYAVFATGRRGTLVRVIVDARFGNLLSVQRVIAVIPPGAYPARQQVDGAVPRPDAPYQTRTSDVRPPGPIARPPALPPEKAEQKSATAPANSNPAVTIDASAAKPAADPKSTKSTSGSPSFPPVQSLE